ncbi:centlein isoform X2 [Cuculus canorus]|uniref:centlein isoform X2 n=1 Tax=Cuculus canorus TaxID=55661 RepID=UPI0023AA4AD6|nr:centlein isoform X2 [Cuculus canorus]
MRDHPGLDRANRSDFQCLAKPGASSPRAEHHHSGISNPAPRGPRAARTLPSPLARTPPREAPPPGTARSAHAQCGRSGGQIQTCPSLSLSLSLSPSAPFLVAVGSNGCADVIAPRPSFCGFRRSPAVNAGRAASRGSPSAGAVAAAMASRRVAELEEELRGLAEELRRCQDDKEFVWSLWKRLQASSPDLTQAVGLVVEREKQKAEVRDRQILEILQAKDNQIETLEQRLTGQQQEINNLIRRKIAVDEENTRLKNEFSDLKQKFKDKSQELKDTEECAQKKEEQNRLVIKNLEEENKGLNTRCADLLNDLEKLRKEETQWRTEKSGNDARIKSLEAELAEAREQIEELRRMSSNLSSQIAVKQEELSQRDCDVIRAKKEIQELENLYRQNIEHTAQQDEVIKQLQDLNTATQKALKDQEAARAAETTYQKLYNKLCFQNVQTSEIQLQQSCASFQDQLLLKDRKICQLQEQLQQAPGALNAVHQNSSPKCEVQVFQQPSLDELECLITTQKSEIKILQEKLEKATLSLKEHNLYATDTLESDCIRSGRKHAEPPVKRSRSLSPKSSFREAEELRKLKIAERKIENLEKTLQLKTQESDELRSAHEKRKERLQMLQTNYSALKEQLKQWEECDSKIESSERRYQHAAPHPLYREDSDAVWNELAFLKREHKKLLIEKLNLEEELNQMKAHQSAEPLFKLSKDDEVKKSTPKRNMKEVSHQTLQKVQQLERRFKAIEGELKKQKEVNKDLLKEKESLKMSLKVQKEDADTRERELEMLLKRICEIKKDKAELQLVIDEQKKEAASLKRQVTEANRLTNENGDLLSQVQELKCLLDEAKAVATSGQCNCKITGTKVKLKTAKKKSSLGHHGAFLKECIKVMSNVFENFSKDGWEDVSESSDSQIPTSESLETLIMKTMQNIDPLPRRSKQQGRKQIQDSQKPCNFVYLEDKTQQYNKKGRSQNGDLGKLCSRRRKISSLTTTYPAIASKVNRTKRRNIVVQKPGYYVTLLQEKIKVLQQQIAVLQNEKKTAVSSVKGFKEANEKLTTELHLANQRLQTSKLTIEVLTSNLAKCQQEKEGLQGKLKLREHLPQTAGKSGDILASSKNVDLEMKQLQCKLKNLNNEITKQSTTIKSLKNEVQEKEEQVRVLQAKISQLERDLSMKRHLIEDLRSRLKVNQENEKTSNETLESLERKDLKLTSLENKMIETQCAMAELETTASQQLHGLAKQSKHTLETVQKKLLLTNNKVEEFMTFVKALTRELQHGVQELRTKIKQAKKMREVRACKKGLSQECFQLAASILNVSTADLEEILEVEDDEETAKTKIEFEKDKEWLQYIQKLLEAQFPFASYLMDAILEKLNEEKKLVEEYNSLMKHPV